jgi:hypothetical protein
VAWILFTYGKLQFWKLDELVARYSEAQSNCPITYTFTHREVRQLLRQFEIIEMRVEHIFPYRICDYIQYKYKKVWYFQLTPKPLFHWLEHHFGWHLCVTAKALK